MPEMRFSVFRWIAAALAATPFATAFAQPEVAGSWSAPVDMPSLAIHMALLPTGKILYWGRNELGQPPMLWDPATGTFEVKDALGTNIFCVGQTHLSDGSVFSSGGHLADHWGLADTLRFDAFSERWERLRSMAYPRWYPTVVVTADGRVGSFGGSMYIDQQSKIIIATIPEFYDPEDNSWREMPSATQPYGEYPLIGSLPDGRLLGARWNWGFGTLDPSNPNATWAMRGNTGFAGQGGIMYRPGKMFKAGDFAGNNYKTATIDGTVYPPTWQAEPNMVGGRSDADYTILPDGTVLITGGTTAFADQRTAVMTPELWNPDTHTLTPMALPTEPRSYHSAAILLPDGRVIKAASGSGGPSYNPNRPNYEIFSPPYLFRGARPVIASAPDLVRYGETFKVATGDAAAIGQVNLLRLGSATHTLNTSQNFVPCTFTAGDGELTVTAPTSMGAAQAGYYMLFILNNDGVPSEAKMLLLSEEISGAALTNVRLLNGRSQSGTDHLANLAASDDVRSTIINGVTRSGGPTTIMEIDLQSPRRHVSSLTFEAEFSWMTPAMVRLQLKNQETGAWITVGDQNTVMGESTYRFTWRAAARDYVAAGTRQTTARLLFYPKAPRLASRVEFDYFGMKVTR